MPRTANDYVELMKHALGKTPDSRHDLWATFNDAGRALFTAGMRQPWFRAWSWTRRYDYALTIPANESLIALPLDFQQLIGEPSMDNRGAIKMVSLEQLTHLKSSNSTLSDQLLAMCFDVGEANRGETHAENVVAIYPTQSSKRSDVRFSYVRKWVEITADDRDRVPDIHSDFERLLLLLSRAYAQEYENQQEPFENAKVIEETNARVMEDAQKVTSRGQPRYSVRQQALYGRGPYHSHNVTVTKV